MDDVSLGLRGDVIAKYAREWVLEIQDISDFVAQQRVHALSGDYHRLLIPTEQTYPVANAEVAKKLGMTLFRGEL